MNKTHTVRNLNNDTVYTFVNDIGSLENLVNAVILYEYKKGTVVGQDELAEKIRTGVQTSKHCYVWGDWVVSLF